MRHRLLRIWVAALLSAGFSLVALSGTHAKTPKPHLVVGKAHGYSFTVKGTGWSAKQTVVFAVSQGGVSSGVEVRTTARGTFAVGILGMVRCAGVSYSAVDLHSRHAQGNLGTTARACLALRPVAQPVVRVLHGATITPASVTVSSLTPSTVRLHLGEELIIDESRTAYTPMADSAYLMLVQAPLACVQDCNAGGSNGIWTFVAIRTGQTGIDLSPACRKLTPPCMMPDAGIRVTIVR